MFACPPAAKIECLFDKFRILGVCVVFFSLIRDVLIHSKHKHNHSFSVPLNECVHSSILIVFFCLVRSTNAHASTTVKIFHFLLYGNQIVVIRLWFIVWTSYSGSSGRFNFDSTGNVGIYLWKINFNCGALSPTSNAFAYAFWLTKFSSFFSELMRRKKNNRQQQQQQQRCISGDSLKSYNNRNGRFLGALLLWLYFFWRGVEWKSKRIIYIFWLVR